MVAIHIEFLLNVSYLYDFPHDVVSDGKLHLESTIGSGDYQHPHDPPRLARVSERLRKTDQETVYLASLDDNRVVFKFVMGEEPQADLEQEAEKYRTCLKGFMGSIVPFFYGLYRVCSQRPNATDYNISCIMLEYCGPHISQGFHELPFEDKHQILTMLGQLHLSKLHYTSFGEHNIVVKDGKYRFVDLDGLDDCHECAFDGNWKLDAVDTADIGCKDLEYIGRDMGVWDHNIPPPVTIGNQKYRSDWYPSQEFIHRFVEAHMTASWNESCLRNWLIRVRYFIDRHGIPAEGDWANDEVISYAEGIRPEMPLTWEEAKELSRKKLRTV